MCECVVAYTPNSNLRKCLVEVSYNVVYMLDTNRETNCLGSDVLLRQFLRTHLRVGGSSWMDYEALHVSHISKERENLQ